MSAQIAYETIDRFFRDVPLHAAENPKLRYFVGTCRFEVEGVGSWLVEADRGRLTVREPRGSEETDCVIRTTEKDFLRLISGEQNPITAFMQGRLQLTGQLSYGERFVQIFP
jgi:predicted lipid carrier protein YhbT